MLSEEQGHSSKKSSSNCLIIVPEFTQSPFFKQPSKFKPQLQLLRTTASEVVAQLHNSILSTADKCSALLHVLASQNPLLSKLLSFSTHLQNFQIFCRDRATPTTRPSHSFAAIIPGDSVAGVVVTNGILNFLNLYNTLLVVRLVLTWFPNAPPAIISPLSTLCDPYLNIFRGLIPPLGGTLDFSPILAFLVLNAFTSTASALPAELPPAGVPPQLSPHATGSPLTTSQKKWMKRIIGNKLKESPSP